MPKEDIFLLTIAFGAILAWFILEVFDERIFGRK